MLLFLRGQEAIRTRTLAKAVRHSSQFSKTKKSENAEEFRVLQLIPPKEKPPERSTFKNITVPPPRSKNMAIDQDWTAVWPGQRSFNQAVVPLPLYQGTRLNQNNPPSKYGNAELMKIPNFLHLTPPAVKKHCEALKQFCTEWPASLNTDEQCEKHFPVQTITTDYCYSSPTIREPLARIVSLKVKLSSLKLNAHDKDKLLRLLGDRYNPKTDTIAITADRCPTKKQNLDYVNYLLTAVYHESKRVEPWEAEKSLADMEYYDWDQNQSRKSLVTVYKWPALPTDLDYETIPHATEYKIAVSDLMNNGENAYSMEKYKAAVKNVLNLKFDQEK